MCQSEADGPRAGSSIDRLTAGTVAQPSHRRALVRFHPQLVDRTSFTYSCFQPERVHSCSKA